MPPSSVAARSLALAVFGVGAAAFAAHGQNVTAFNPYSGAGLPGGALPQYGSQPASPAIDTAGPAPTAGPAFNPWTSSGQDRRANQAYGPSAQSYDPGASLPPPPPGPIASRIVAVPELTTNRSGQKASVASAAPKTAPKPTTVAAVSSKAPPAPPPAKPAAVATPPAPVSIAAPAAPEQKMAAVAPPPSAPARVPLTLTLAFPPRSAELSDASRTELDRLIKNVSDRGLRQVEVRSFAANGEPDSRKVSLARALNIRTYLIDKGVKSKIEIGTFSSSDGNERVDIVVPST